MEFTCAASRKIGLLILLTSIGLSKYALSQNNNPCGKSWSEWRSAWNFSYGAVKYRLEFPSKNCGCGYNFVQMKHNLNYRASVKIRLEGIDCDGKMYSESFSAEIGSGEVSSKAGNYHHFKSLPNVASVEIDFENENKKIRVAGDKSGNKTYINGMSEESYNQQQQKKASGSSRSSSNNSSPKKVVSGTADPAISFPQNGSSGTTQSNNVKQNQAQIAEQQRIQREEASRKQREAERRQREEAARQNELRYKAQLQEITRKSEARAQRDAGIMQGVGALFSMLEQEKIRKGLAEDAIKRKKRIDEFNSKSTDPDYELIDCNTCRGVGYKSCGTCQGKGEKVCMACSGNGGKRCSSCGGTGKKGWGTYTLACTNCSGTGTKQCMACGNKGIAVCITCYGRGEDQCYCDGTGKKLHVKSSRGGSNKEATSQQVIDRQDALTYALQQAEIDTKILAGFPSSFKPTEEGPDSVYYIRYSRYYVSGITPTAFVELYVMYKYSDDTYPLLSAVFEKIKFNPFTSTDGIGRFLGYFQSRHEANTAMTKIAERSIQQQINAKIVKEPKRINPPTPARNTNDNFWNN